MTPTERETALRALSDTIEQSLATACGGRVNFVLVMCEFSDNEDHDYVSYLTNTPRPLAAQMLNVVFNESLAQGA